ncbi:hypothetical protein JJJ17_17520 [Paracoccus caeni]|uniref:Uncharacterized protein n=1 Tax=Paracoccus caeni TaxID=657651 RepID=A0A934SHV6_9RHOB|nr:hypothetical protein [Paracoccus caeni]MBK4217735.1 hypothetical protein [Paracoccus caeni]
MSGQIFMAMRRGEAMPNYSKLEQQLLNADQLALTADSRQPALGNLDEAGLFSLISRLQSAVAEAGPVGADGQKLAADILTAALRRAHGERRKRGLKPVATATEKTGTPAAKPAAKRKPASPARKPAGRSKAETRKPDLRTGSRRVAKAVKPATAVSETVATQPKPASAAETAKPKPAPRKPKAAQPAPVAAPAPVTTVSAEDEKARKKAVRKAAKKAANVAEKEARKAVRKAEKEAVKAARKAAKKAAKAADKVARKAERQAADPAKSKAAKPKSDKPKADKSKSKS